MRGPLWRIGWRYLARHRWQSALMVLGVALGVAVIVAIDLANTAASRAFDLSTEAIAGRATHQIVGGPRGLDENIYRRLRVEGGVRAAAPVITEYVRSERLGGRVLQLLGVDPFAEPPFRDYFSRSNPDQPTSPADLVDFLTRPGALILSENLAAEHGLAARDMLTLTVMGRATPVQIAGLLRPQDQLSRRALDDVLLADIATVQELTGRVGYLDSIDLILPEGDTALAGRVAGQLPADAQIVPVGARAGTVGEMTAAFRLNLTALSLLALLVGMFLIYNNMTFAVVQRRALFGMLRCLGVTRREVGWLVLGEVLLVGVAGSALGLVLGMVLGQGAVRLVTQTINDLYYVVSVRGVAVEMASLVKGALVGVVATVASAAAPAWEAASVPPQLALRRSVIEDKARRLVPVTSAAGIAGLLLGSVVLALPVRSLYLAFGGLFAIVIGFALMAPLATVLLMRTSAGLGSRILGVVGRMAPRSVAGALSRTAVAVAALMVAVSVTVGVGLMVGSFRQTVVSWLDQTLSNDIYISAPGVTATRPSAVLDPRVVAIAGAWPGVRRADTLRSVDVASPAGPIALSAIAAPDFVDHRLFLYTEGGVRAAAEAVRQGAVLVSEPLALRLSLPRRGAMLTLNTDQGPRAFPVAGVYRDYASSQGNAMMALDLYQRNWDDRALSAVSLLLEPGVDADQVTRDLSVRLADVQGVSVRPNRVLRLEVLQVFDRAFAITGALQLLAAGVAFIGVLSALLALQLERTRELGVLRAVGLTIRQLRQMVLLETGLMGLVAGLLSLPTGLALAWILVYVINRRSFGWTLQFQVDPWLFVQALLLALAAALLAGLYPAWRLGRTQAAEALRGE